MSRVSVQFVALLCSKDLQIWSFGLLTSCTSSFTNQSLSWKSCLLLQPTVCHASRPSSKSDMTPARCRYTVTQQMFGNYLKVTASGPVPALGAPLFFVDSFGRPSHSMKFQFIYAETVGTLDFYNIQTFAGNCVEVGTGVASIDGGPAKASSVLTEQKCDSSSLAQLFSFVPSTGKLSDHP